MVTTLKIGERVYYRLLGYVFLVEIKNIIKETKYYWAWERRWWGIFPKKMSNPNVEYVYFTIVKTINSHPHYTIWYGRSLPRQEASEVEKWKKLSDDYIIL